MNFYDDHADAYAERTLALNMSEIYRKFLPCLPSHGRILDVGCGPGRDLKFFHDQGFQVEGIDSSREMVKRALRWGVPVHQKSIEEIREENQFDGVWASASLLHLKRPQFVSSLLALIKALRPKGALYFSVKMGEGEMTDSEGRFFAFYRLDDLKQILSQLPYITLKEVWISGDSLGRDQVQWINVIALKK